jgi:SAM-dependent methyltransferase
MALDLNEKTAGLFSAPSTVGRGHHAVEIPTPVVPAASSASGEQRTGDLARTIGRRLLAAARWPQDHLLSIAYGLVYDYIFERFAPYRALRREVLQLLESTVQSLVDPKAVRVLDVGCGPGNFTLDLARVGFSAVGVEPYRCLLELAREKRRAGHLASVSFRQDDLGGAGCFADASFDHVVAIHVLYSHPAPDALLRNAYRVLRPGGRAVFVNHTRRVGLGAIRRELDARGLLAALECLLWVLPNSIFETLRKPVGPHYWAEDEFAARVTRAGFTVLDVRRTFLHDASLLVWAEKDCGSA